MSGFFDLDNGEELAVGKGILRAKSDTKPKSKRHEVNKEQLEQVGERTGFSRRVSSDEGAVDEPALARRRGRPPINEEMTYWRIYIKPSVRDRLCKLRDERGVRLNDLIEEMLHKLT
jgi:hypothetical protein